MANAFWQADSWFLTLKGMSVGSYNSSLEWAIINDPTLTALHPSLQHAAFQFNEKHTSRNQSNGLRNSELRISRACFLPAARSPGGRVFVWPATRSASSFLSLLRGEALPDSHSFYISSQVKWEVIGQSNYWVLTHLPTVSFHHRIAYMKGNK